MSIVTDAYLNSLEEDGVLWTLSDATISQKSISADNIKCESKSTDYTFNCDSATVTYNTIGDNLLLINIQNLTISCSDYPSSGECIIKFPKPSSAYFITFLSATQTGYNPSISDTGSHATITVTGDWSEGEALQFRYVSLFYLIG